MKTFNPVRLGFPDRFPGTFRPGVPLAERMRRSEPAPPGSRRTPGNYGARPFRAPAIATGVGLLKEPLARTRGF